jgi:hypothetical protein
MKFLSYIKPSSARSFLKRYKELDLLFQFDKDTQNWSNAAESAELRNLFRDAITFHASAENYDKAIELSLKYFLRPRLFVVTLRRYLVEGVKSDEFKDDRFKKDYEVTFI